MAEKVTLELEAKIGQAKADLEKLTQEVEQLNKETLEFKENTEDLGKATKKGKKGFDGIKNSVKGLGTAFKAIGIGAIIAAFVKLGEIFSQNQRVADAFATASAGFSKVINDFADFVLDSFPKVSNLFKSVFENPLESINKLGSSIKQGLINRFNQFIEVLGFAGEAAKQFFSGNFVGAMEAAKKAGREMVDVVTGEDGGIETIANAFNSVVDGVKNYAKETANAAKASVELNNQARIAAAVQQGLLEDYDRQAEIQRQIRDDETKTFEEREAANTRLGEILEKQKVAMIEQADLQIAAAQMELKKANNVENQVALQEAINNKKAIEAQITGFQSEQLINVNSLEKERLENLEEINKLGLEGDELAKQELLDELTRQETLINRTVQNEETKNKLLLEAKQRYNDAVADIDAQAKEKKDADDKTSLENEKKLVEQKVALAGKSAGDIAAMLGEQTKAGKAASAAQALINTYQGISNVWAEKSESGLVGAGLAQRIATTAIVAAQGFKTVKSILGVSPTSPSGSVSSSGGGQVAQAPQFNLVGSGGTNQLASAIGSQTQQPVKAYVVGSEVTSQQALDRQISSTASLGDD